MKKSIIAAILIASIGTANAQVGLGYNYIISSNKSSSSTTNLFADNGHAITFKLRGKNDNKGTPPESATSRKYDPGPKKGNGPKGIGIGFTASAGYQFGKTSQDDLTAFAKTLTAPSGYKIGQSSTNWKQVVVMGGPVLRLGKRNNGLMPFDISAEAGAAFKLAPRRITIDKTDGQAVTSRVFDKTDNSTIFAWQVNASLPVFKLGKRVTCNLEAGYGFNGGTVGITFKYFKATTRGWPQLPGEPN